MCSGRAEAAGPGGSTRLRRQKACRRRGEPAQGVRGRRRSWERALCPRPGLSAPQRLPGRGPGLLGPPPHRVQREEDPRAGGDEQEHPEEPAAREVHANAPGVLPVRHPCTLSSRAGGVAGPGGTRGGGSRALPRPAHRGRRAAAAAGPCSSPCVLARPEVATTPETEPASLGPPPPQKKRPTGSY